MSPVFISDGDQLSGSGVAAVLIPAADTAALMTPRDGDHLLGGLWAPLWQQTMEIKPDYGS